LSFTEKPERLAMRSPLALLAGVLLALATSACGSATKVTDSAGPSSSSVATRATPTIPPSRSAPPGSYLKWDGDKPDDSGGKRGNDDPPFLKTYGPPARATDRRAVSALVKRYYTAAVAEKGARACGLLTSALANSVATGVGRSAPNVDGGCAPSMSLLLEQQHQQLAAREPATMVVIGVYVKGDLGLALLGFRRMPESTLIVEREAHVWKIDALFDSLLT
jgi:hypothetical protein